VIIEVWGSGSESQVSIASFLQCPPLTGPTLAFDHFLGISYHCLYFCNGVTGFTIDSETSRFYTIGECYNTL